MPDPVQELRSANLAQKRACLSRVTRSPLPAPVTKTLTLILEHFGSATHYSLAWVSHRKLAELQGCAERTIERHCKAILEAGLLTAEKMGCGQAKALLQQKFNHEMKGVYPHFLCFYRVNTGHPFWNGDKEATGRAVATVRQAVSWPARQAAKSNEPRHTCRHSDALNPDTGDALNPDTGDALNPDTGDGRAGEDKEETLADAPVSSLETAVAVAPAVSKSNPNSRSIRRGDEPQQTPTGEDPLMSRGDESRMNHAPTPGTADPDEAPRKPTTWERIESAATRKSTDSPAELAELWRDRRPAIVALYREAGIDPHPETVVSDTLQVMEHTFDNRLSLGALLGPRWDRFHQALARWLAAAEERIWPDLQYVTATLNRPLSTCSDEEIVSTWNMVTGQMAPCPPVAVLRRMTAR